MEFTDVLSKRRMVRNYTSEQVDGAVVGRIARAALRAPSAGNSQAIGVVVVTSPEIRRKIAELAGEHEYVGKGFDPWISRAPVHIVISVSEKIYRARYSEPDKVGPDGKLIDWPTPYWWIDAGAAMMSVLLSAVDEGLAAGFLGVHSVPDLAGELGLPSHRVPIGVITLGHPAPDRRSGSLNRPRIDPAQAVQYDSWVEPE